MSGVTGTGSPRFWEPPSGEVARLIRQGVERLMDDPGKAVAALEEATLSANVELIAMDDRFADAVRAASRANLNQWATANLRNPGLPVPANTGPENSSLARDVVRHGLTETIPVGFRAGQNVLSRLWTDMAFDLTADVPVLRELLDVVTRSVHAYVDDTLTAIQDMIRRERDQLTNATHAARREVVELILQGAPLSLERASRRLHYDLARHHLAAVVWSDVNAPPGVERVADALARAAGTSRPLNLPISPSTSWVWLSSHSLLEAETVRDAMEHDEQIRVALGTPAPSLAGFRKSHLEAMATQRLARRLPNPPSLTTYEDVEVVALATGDEERVVEFVARTLGPLAQAPAELRDTLRIYLREQCNATRTARVLFSHRNTVMARVERAVQLLPRGLDDRTLNVGLALEILQRWGPPSIR